MSLENYKRAVKKIPDRISSSLGLPTHKVAAVIKEFIKEKERFVLIRKMIIAAGIPVHPDIFKEYLQEIATDEEITEAFQQCLEQGILAITPDGYIAVGVRE
jgi:methionyl-tRNA formyltransferase